MGKQRHYFLRVKACLGSEGGLHLSARDSHPALRMLSPSFAQFLVESQDAATGFSSSCERKRAFFLEFNREKQARQFISMRTSKNSQRNTGLCTRRENRKQKQTSQEAQRHCSRGTRIEGDMALRNDYSASSLFISPFVLLFLSRRLPPFLSPTLSFSLSCSLSFFSLSRQKRQRP